MRMAMLAVAAAFLVFVPAQAGTYTSDQLGFSAEFPIDPEVGTPQASETDAKGKAIADSVIVQARVLGMWNAMVTVDSYIRPAKIDAATTLAAMPKLFVGQLDGTLTSSKAGKVDGKPARFFSYTTKDKSSSGKGIAIVVAGAKPRTYLVLTSATSMASAENNADLEKFLASFHVK